MNKLSKIYIAGHDGMVGSSIMRLLQSKGYKHLITRSIDKLNLKDFGATKAFFELEQPEIVILAAARVGGIRANIEYPAEFLYDNLIIQNNVIHLSYLTCVKKLCFLGSSCIYPRECPQPMKEEYLMSGPLEPTNEGYALAKVVGIKMLESYSKQYGFHGISIIPCNLYGTNDNFDVKYAHVLSSLVKRFVDAVDNDFNEITVWGTGCARREFMHVDDAAEAILFMLDYVDIYKIINVGWGRDISIKELAFTIADIVGFKGKIKWDSSKPDGMLRKCLDVSLATNLGFTSKITLEEGIQKTIDEYRGLI